MEDVLVTVREALEQQELDHRKLNKKLRASEERYRKMIEIVQEGIGMLDAEAKTPFVNPRMSALLGYAVHEMLDRPLYDFMGTFGTNCSGSSDGAHLGSTFFPSIVRGYDQGGSEWRVLLLPPNLLLKLINQFLLNSEVFLIWYHIAIPL